MRIILTAAASQAVLALALLLAACSGGKDDSSGKGRDGGSDDDGGEATAGTSGGAGDGGGAHADGGVTLIPGLEALRITPASHNVVDDGVEPGETVSFKAVGTFGKEENDVTGQVMWSLADARLGTIDKGVFTSAGIGGSTEVRARAVGFEATAMLTIKLEIAAKTDGAPDGIVELFEPDPSTDTKVEDDTLRIVYPSHETMFPRNLQRVDHQFRADANLDRFELRFESPVALVRFYTADKHFLPDAQSWKWLADSHAGSSLTFTVRGTSSAAPDTIVQSQPVTLYYSESEVPGALYYWSTGAQGVLKATISSEFATKFFTDPAGADTTCVSCHTVSRNGQKLSAGYGGETLRTITVPDRDLLIPSAPADKGPAYGWGTFSPDASRLFYANKGALTMLDADDGTSLFTVDLAGKRATHPDWAPSDEYIAIVLGAAKMDNKNAQGTSLARLPVKANGTLDAPEILLASTDGMNDTIVFPSYSPDSKWIAFVRTTGKSKDSVKSVLYLLAADGGEPIELARLNQRVRHEDGVIDIGNSMPTWAPSTKPGVFWLAFSSLRAYGDVLAEGRDQLWAAAIDPSKIASGKDPSYAAFWMPFQDMEQGNHRAFWAIDTEAECPATIEICDSLDNDCDGVVDEDCCTPQAEICDGEDNNCDGIVDEGCCVPEKEICDGKDNNCNLVVDEGCGCGTTEICGNGMDDNCNGDIDENCVD